MEKLKIKEIYNLIEKEVVRNTSRSFVNVADDMTIVYEALQGMAYRGKLVYPQTYKYRKELSKLLKEYIEKQIEKWERRQ